MKELKQKIDAMIESIDKMLSDKEELGQQKFQDGFRAGTGCTKECMAVVEHAERFVRCRDNYELLRSAVLDLITARAGNFEQ